MFEDSEYSEPAKAFREEGHTLVHVGLRKDEEVKGEKAGTTVKIDASVKEADPDDFDALFIPGGHSPDRLRADDDAVKFAKSFMMDNKPVLGICHGPQILITADVLKGRKATGYKSIRQDIKNAGADFLDQEVVEDGNLITSRNPNDIPAFIKASLSIL